MSSSSAHDRGSGLRQQPGRRRGDRHHAAAASGLPPRKLVFVAIRIGDMYRPDFRDRHPYRGGQESARRRVEWRRCARRREDFPTQHRDYAACQSRSWPPTRRCCSTPSAGKRLLFEGAWRRAVGHRPRNSAVGRTTSRRRSSGVGVSSGSECPAADQQRVYAQSVSTASAADRFRPSKTTKRGCATFAIAATNTARSAPRRCGCSTRWPLAGTAQLALKGVDCLAIMLLDVLSDLPS